MLDSRELDPSVPGNGPALIPAHRGGARVPTVALAGGAVCFEASPQIALTP